MTLSPRGEERIEVPRAAAWRAGGLAQCSQLPKSFAHSPVTHWVVDFMPNGCRVGNPTSTSSHSSAFAKEAQARDPSVAGSLPGCLGDRGHLLPSAVRQAIGLGQRVPSCPLPPAQMGTLPRGRHCPSPPPHFSKPSSWSPVSQLDFKELLALDRDTTSPAA